MTDGGSKRQRRAWRAGVALTAGIYVGAVTQAVHGLFAGDRWSWAAMSAAAAAYGVAVALVPAMQRFFGTRDVREGRALVRHALDEGRLPPDAWPVPWRAALIAAAEELRQARWTGAFLVLIGGLVAAATVVANNSAPELWVLAVVLIGFAAVPVRWLTRRAQRAEALLAQLGPE
jgi:hypothetical protein